VDRVQGVMVWPLAGVLVGTVLLLVGHIVFDFVSDEVWERVFAVRLAWYLWISMAFAVGVALVNWR
jgi:hypothetical protein